MLSKSGDYRWVQDRGQAHFDARGAVNRVTGSRTDVDERKRLASDLESARLSLAARVTQLEAALAEVRELRGILPICSYCKNIRDDENYWTQVEDYVARRTDAQFSHAICPGCYDREVRPQLTALRERRAREAGAARSADTGQVSTGGAS